MSEKKACPLNRNYYCDDRCKWFDEDAEDCRLIFYLGDISRMIKDNDKRF